MKAGFAYRSGVCFAVLLAFATRSRGASLEESCPSEAQPSATVDLLSSNDPLPEAIAADSAASPDADFGNELFDDFMESEELDGLEAVSETWAPEHSAETTIEVKEGAGSWRKKVFPYFRLGGYYDDNIFISETERESDFVGFAGFGLRAGLGEVVAPLYGLREKRNVPILYETSPPVPGNFVWADYSGMYRFFLDHSEQSSYDQDLLMRLGWTDGKVTLGLEGRFQSLSTPDIDAGGRVRRYIFHAGAEVDYQLSELTSVEADFSYTNVQYTSLIDSSEFLHESWLNYQLTPKLKVAGGIGVGVLTMQGGPNQPYGRVLVRAVYEYSPKLSFSGRLGLEYRDVQEGSAFRNNPVFGLGITYAPWDGTFISLEGYRFAEASAMLAGADYTITGVDLTVRQRFFQRFILTLTGGYENWDYRFMPGDSSVKRNDNYFFGRAAIAFDITRWCNAEIFYSYQRDSSTYPGNSFTDNLVGIGFDFAF